MSIKLPVCTKGPASDFVGPFKLTFAFGLRAFARSFPMILRRWREPELRVLLPSLALPC